MLSRHVSRHVIEERLRRALRGGHTILWEWDLGSGSVAWSDNVSEILGGTYEHRTAFEERVHPEDRERQRATLDKTLSEDEPYDLEMRFIKPDGEVIWIEEKAELQSDQDGRRILSGITIDITARKQAEARAQEKAALSETILEQMDQGLILVDAEDRIQAYNRKVLELLDLPEELMRLPLPYEAVRRHQWAAGEFANCDENLRHPIVNGAPVRALVRYERQRPDGTVLEVRSTPLPGGGEVRTFTDITQQRRTEEQLREAQKLANNAARIGTWDLDLVTGRGRWDEQALRIGGMPTRPQEYSSESWADAIHPDDRDRVRQAFEASLAPGGAPYDVEFRSAVPADDGGERWLVSHGAVLHDPSGSPVRAVGIVRDVTSRKRSEEALRASEARLAAVLESISDGFFALDGDWRFTVFNAAAERFFGRSRSEVIGRALHEAFPEAVGSDFEQRYGRLMAGGQGFTLETRLPGRPDRVVEMRAAAMAGGGIAVAFSDITERTAAEEALRDSERRLQTLVENLPIGVNVMDRDGTTLLSNPAFRAILPEEVIPSRLPEAEQQWIAHDEQGRRLTRDRFPGARALRGEAVSGIEFLHRTPAGREVWTRISGVPLRDQSGQLTGALSVIVDIDAQKRAQQALARLNDTLESQVEERTRELVESQRRLSTLLDNLPGFAYRCLNRPDWPLEYMSEGVRAIVGYEPADFQGPNALTWAEVMYPEDLERVWHEVQMAVQEDRHFEFTYRVRARDGGERWVWERGRAVHTAEGGLEALEGFIADVTEQRQIEEQLRQAQKMEAVGQLTGGVAHDFNNLLTVIMGNAEILFEGLTDPRKRANAEAILKAAERGSSLTQQLLAFGRRQSLRPEAVRLDQVVDSLTPLLHRTLGEHIDLRTEYGQGAPAALADRSLLENAILNLALNARDAMPRGGTLTIRTGERIAGPGNGSIPIGQPVVFVALSDTGTGMAPEILARVFEPFFTTKDVGKGSGLGLSMVYGFAEQSGGHVSITSTPGGGTTVTILLRAVGNETKQVPKDEGTFGNRGHGRVLLVEDEAAVCQFVSSQLADLGYEVRAVSCGPEALALLAQDGEFDLLFTDVVLPKGMSGVELADHARRINPRLQVVLTSGYPREVFEHHGRPDADLEFLRKPYKRSELAEMLKGVLERTRPRP